MALAGSTLGAGATPTQLRPAIPGDPATISELEEAFRISEIHAEFVVVIDISGSMSGSDNPPYPKVLEAYADLVNAIPDGDYLALVLFDSLATVAFAGDLTRDNRAEAIEKLPPVAEKGGTDIGLALQSAASRLGRPDASDYQTLIFITDGRHKPLETSPFWDNSSSAWAELRAQGKELTEALNLQVRALGLGGQGKLGAELVNTVFPGTEVVELGADQLSDYLTNEVAKSRRARLVNAIQDEIDSGVVKATIETSKRLASRVEATLTLTSSMPHLGVDVDLRDIEVTTSDGATVRSELVDGSGIIHIPPAGTVTVRVVLKPAVGPDRFFPLPPKKLEEIDVSVALAGTALATPGDVLSELSVEREVMLRSPDEFTLARTTGTTWPRFFLRLLGLLLGLVFIAWLWWKFVRKPRLQGQVSPTYGEPLKLSGKRRRLSAKELGVGAGPAEILLYTKRGKHGRVYVRILKDYFERGDGYDWEAFKSGSALGAATYRLNRDAGPEFVWNAANDIAR